MVTTEPEQSDNSLEARQAAFSEWVETVRNPAREHSEGLRQLTVLNGAAIADYEIAPLPHGRWAITLNCTYRCGHCHGVGVPWTDFESREACIEFFLTIARRHFGSPTGADGSGLQRRAQTEMAEFLRGGLFGFIEPLPSSGYEDQQQRTPFTHEEHDHDEDETATGP